MNDITDCKLYLYLFRKVSSLSSVVVKNGRSYVLCLDVVVLI
jgi:hypothetical protein